MDANPRTVGLDETCFVRPPTTLIAPPTFPLIAPPTLPSFCAIGPLFILSAAVPKLLPIPALNSPPANFPACPANFPAPTIPLSAKLTAVAPALAIPPAAFPARLPAASDPSLPASPALFIANFPAPAAILPKNPSRTILAITSSGDSVFLYWAPVPLLGSRSCDLNTESGDPIACSSSEA